MVAQLWLPSDMLKTKTQKGGELAWHRKTPRFLLQHHRNPRFCQKFKVILY